MKKVLFPLRRFCLEALFAGLLFSGASLAQVTTYHYDQARTGATLSETVLNTANVNVNNFGKLFSLTVDAQIYTQPLYVPNVNIPQQGLHNVIYVGTQNNSFYAFDADTPGNPLWQVNLGPPMPQGVCCEPKDILPQIGITSTPVIDLDSGMLYVVAETYESPVTYFRLHALDIATGADRLTPAVIQGSVPGKSSDSQNGVLTFSPIFHWQRAGLVLSNGTIYIGFGSHSDDNPYHGWLFAYDAATLQQTSLLSFAPDTLGNGLWQGGASMAVDTNGNLYLQSGNGPFDANTGGRDYGDSVVKLGTSGGLRVLDYFSPSTQLLEGETDIDLGSSGPVLIPGTSLGVAGGKNGKIFLFNINNLGQYETGPNGTDGVVQEWPATFATSYPSSPGGFWGGNYIFYNSTLYGFGERDSLKAFAFNGSQFNTIPTSQSTVIVPSGFSNDPAISISANGTIAGTGIVWAVFSSTGVANGSPVPGELHAFDASNVSQELWNSKQNSARDSSGSYSKWAPPIVVNGQLYLATFDNALNVYGLLPAGRTISSASGTPQSASVNQAFGIALQAVVKDSNNNPVAGVAVTFTAPGTGASATFSGGVSANAITNASGVATAPALMANGQTGFYRLSATATGAGPAATFSLTNISGTPATISALAGTPQSSIVGNAFATPLQVFVKDAGNNPVSGATVTFTAPLSGASAAFSGSVSATATTNSSGMAAAPVLAANGQTGSYSVIASVAGVTTSASFSLTNTVISSGALSGSGNSSATTANLTTEGTIDWVHWGTTAPTRKSGVTTQITTYSVMGTGTEADYTNDPRALTWSDGTPTTAGTDNAGVNITTAPNGFSFTAPADATVRVLTVHVGGFNSGGAFTAHLSDNSAADFVDTATASGAYDRNYTLTYHAMTAGQTLKITWVAASGAGYVSLNGAALAMAGPSITATAGTPQNATANTISATALQAIIKDPYGNPLSGVMVTFTAPASGASGSFGGSSTTTAVTNSSGIATAPAFTANNQTGSYTVTATAPGVVTRLGYSLTNVFITIAATAGTSQTTPINSAFAVPLQVTLKNANNSPVNGVTVTFTAPTSTATAAFSGSSTVTAVTNASGVATAPTLTANGLTGSYTVAASAPLTGGPVTFNLTNTVGGGGLTGSATSSNAAVDLTAEGPTDWVHWGTTPLTRKNGVTPQISPYTVVGGGMVQAYTNDPRAQSWSDGAPTLAASDNSGVFVNGIPNGFSFTAPADTMTRILTVHVGGFNSGSTFTAHLSDGSAPDFVDSPAPAISAYDRNYTLTYHAAAAGQTISISWVNSGGFGNVTLSGAALFFAGPNIAATVGTPQSAVINTVFGTALQATVTSAGTPANGVTVTFTALSSGPSATFGGSTTATAVTNASGVATTPTLTANGQAGSYTVTASAPGVSTPASFTLTNTAVGGTLTGAATSSTTTANLTAEGSLDWIHWGIGAPTRKNGVTAQLTTYTLIGIGSVQTYGNDPRALTWSDGTPTASGTDSTGLYVNNTPNGFSFTAPADSTTRILTVHAGGFNSGGSFTAHLSDGSSPDYVDTTTTVAGAFDRNYTLTYHATAPSQTLTISWVNSSGSGNVTLNGAALSSAGPVITPAAGTPQSASINTAFATALQATVTSAGTPANGVTVTFTALSSGPSATFGGSTTATAVTNASGVATTPTLTANGQAGSYTVTASAPGVSTPASFTLTNTAVGGTLTGSATSSTTTANLTAEGSLDWIHWGIGAPTRKNGVTAQLTTYTLIGIGSVQTYGNDPRALTWSDGTPTASGTDSTGLYVNNTPNGFSFTAPADSTTRILTVHAGGFNSGGSFTAHLSDGSSPDYVDTTTTVAGAFDRNYTLTYHATAPSQTLTISWVNSSGSGNVTLNGAALSSAGPVITPAAGTPQSASINTAFATALQATVTSAGTPANGVTVTFTAPSSGPSATFGGSTTATAVTNASGVATTPTLTANGQAGSYTVTASAPGVSTPASFTLTNTAVGGTLTGAATSSTTTANLTAEGSLDWIHWGIGAPTRKNGVTAQLTTYTLIGIGSVQTYGNDPRALTWSDGTPTASGTDSTGLYVNNTPNGFSFTAPADSTTRILTVHAGGFNSGGSFTAHLSDGSSPDYVDTTTTVAGAFDRNYTLTYHATAPSQTLTISWVNSSGSGNVTLNGAALSSAGPVITPAAGTPQSASINTAFATALQATVTSAGTPANGVTVTFTAPSSGPSATFGGSTTATAVTNASGVATTPTLTANGQAGSYTVTASAPGVSTPASFTLTNTAVGGTLTGAATSSTTTANLTAEGSLDWIHWGIGAPTRKNGVTAQLTTYTLIGIGSVQTYGNDPRALTWSDGTPTASGTDSTGLYVNNTPNGFSFTAPADSTTRILTVHAGGFNSGGSFTAHLSDGSSPDYVDTTTTVAGAFDRNYTLTYHATAPSQTLTISWVNSSGSGNVTLNGAALSSAGPVITPAAGTPQSASINTAFATALQATVTSAGTPANGVTVTFTAPSSGPSATFGGSTTATAVTNASGVATTPTLTANGQAGSYTVTASAPGVSTPASFTLTNTAVGGTLTGAATSSTTTANLTAEGSLDWIHWGIGAPTRKNGVTAQLTTYTLIGIGSVQTYGNDPRALTWSDGTPTASGTDSTGLYVNNTPNGFSFTAPADSTTRILTVHAGGFNSGGSFTAHLSDGSSPDYVDTTTTVAGAFDRNYTLTYHATAPSQTLTISWVNSSGSGNVTLNGVALK